MLNFLEKSASNLVAKYFLSMTEEGEREGEIPLPLSSLFPMFAFTEQWSNVGTVFWRYRWTKRLRISRLHLGISSSLKPLGISCFTVYMKFCSPLIVFIYASTSALLIVLNLIFYRICLYWPFLINWTSLLSQ